MTIGRQWAAVMLLLLSSIAGARTASAQIPPATPESFQAAQRAVAGHSDGFFLDDAPGSAQLLQREWSVVEDRAAQFLDAHPKASEDAIAAALAQLYPDLGVNIVALAPQAFLVAARDGQLGTAFIVARQRGHFGAVWRIGDSAARPPSGFTAIAAWAPDHARADCRKTRPKAWMACGPVAASSIGRLPDMKDGTHRFYIDAGYAQLQGGTASAQISLWQWKSGRPTPVFGGTYDYVTSHEVHAILDGNVLRVHIKEDFKTFAACNACDGRLLEWTIRIEPERIVDLGRVSLVPELDLADALFGRLLTAKPVADIADPSVAPAIMPMIEQARQNPPAKGQPPLGALEESRLTVADDGASRSLCIATDAGGPYLLAIDGPPTRLHVSSATAVPGCGS